MNIDSKIAPFIDVCIENEAAKHREELMQACTVWIRKDADPEQLKISDIVIEPVFPCFKTEFRETQVQRLERWGREYKDIAARQEIFITHALALTFVNETLKNVDWNSDTMPLLAANMHKEFIERIGYFHLQFANFICAIKRNKLTVSLEYKIRESLHTHNIYISNQK